MNIAALLQKSARSFGTSPAVSYATCVYMTYSELANRVQKLASGFVNCCGLKRGDRVGIAMTNCPAFTEVLYAIWHAGLVAVPMNAKLHQREISYIIENAGVRLCMVNRDLEATVGPLCDSVERLDRVVSVDTTDYRGLLTSSEIPLQCVNADDPAWLFYTSGTTGRPKGATLTHRNLMTMTLSYFADLESLSHSDCIIHSAPLSHGSGLYGIPHLAKAANQVLPESGGFDPLEINELLVTWPSSGFFFAPTMIVRLLASGAVDGEARANLRTIIYGGGPMYTQDLYQALDVFGPRLIQIYGQGESPMTITYLSKLMHEDKAHPRFTERMSSVGIPRTDVELAVVDENGWLVADNQPGEIIVRGEVVMKGYWENREATAAALKDGWLYTGDVGVIDSDGFLTLKDRTKDMIISGGSNIYPREVEEVLLQHDAVLETSVVGRFHPDWGEEVVAFVVLKPGGKVSKQDLDNFCLENIARFKRPKNYRFLDSLPKNNYGKILKTELREQLESDTDDTDAPH
jgi:acyl-CoA synthetase (AMP-forming)/AMP-acid ligase II